MNFYHPFSQYPIPFAFHGEMFCTKERRIVFGPPGVITLMVYDGDYIVLGATWTGWLSSTA